MRLSIVAISLCFLGVTFMGCNSFTKVQKSKDYNYKLQKADEYYAKAKFMYAQQLYEELFGIFKGTDKFEELYYKYSLCLYNQEMYGEASASFKGYLEVFPNNEHSEEVDYLRALCFYKQSPKLELEQVNTLKTIGMMQTFINTHPGSARIKEATEIIDKSREKLELKAFRGAQLYYNIGEYRASAIAFSNLMYDFPETKNGDEYQYLAIKAYYKFATLSVVYKQLERFEKVISEYDDFVEKYPDSKWVKEAEEYKNLSLHQIKNIENEQTSSSSKW